MNIKELTIDQAIRDLPLGVFDYLWLIDTQPANSGLPPGAVLVWSRPGSTLYRLSGAPKDVSLGPQQTADNR